MQEKTSDELRALYFKVRSIRGGMNELAFRANVTRMWVWRVFKGDGTSLPVIRAAQQLIAEREKSQTN